MKFEEVAGWPKHTLDKCIKIKESKFHLFNFFISTHKFF
jgi:hypothetical protein